MRININSGAGISAKVERAVYNPFKWAITSFTKALQTELSRYKIKICAIYPSLLKTNMFTKMGIQKDMSKGLELEEVAKTIEFVLSLRPETEIVGVEIKHIDYT